MSHPLLLKLSQFMELSQAEQDLLTRTCAAQTQYEARAEILRAGAPVNAALLVSEGWAIRSRSLPDGRRQILNFVLPGDFCDPTAFVERTAASSISALTPVRIAHVTTRQVLELVTHSPRLGAAFWWHEAYEGTMVRAHLVAVGRMTAYERIAYLLRELGSRLRAIGLGQDHRFQFPGTQSDLADALGLSNVHVSRTLRRLSDEGIVEIARSGITIRDSDRLDACAKLKPPIEHLRGAPAGLEKLLAKRRDSA